MKTQSLRRLMALVLSCLLAAPLWATDTSLPVRSVVLYKHGVAYFERESKLDGTSDIALEFKSTEMSDVLKSLTLLSAGGSVGSISYEASDPLQKQLAEFGFSLAPDASLGQVLDQFRGARVSMHLAAGSELKGSILGVRRTLIEKNETETIALLLDGGEMRSISMREVTGLRMEDPRLQQQLESYLQLLRDSHRRDSRVLRIHPGGARAMAVGYVLAAPVWKSSYRLVLDAQKPKEALLQGWAIVDNTSSEDWKGVTLALVSGLPVSFTQNLYQAHYINRPNVPLPSEMAAAPREFEGGVMGGIGGGVVGGVPAGTGGVSARNVAELQKDERLYDRAKRADQAVAKSMMAPMAPPPPAKPVMNMEMNARDISDSVQVAASAREFGELFEYRIDRQVDIPRNQSAMIPFVQTPVKVERVLLYSRGTAGEHPYDAVLMENTTGKTLDGGAITVIEGNQYAGESLVQTMKTGDSRPVTFAVDLGSRVTTAFDTVDNFVYSAKIRRGMVQTQAKNVATTTYTVRNTDGKAKPLVIEHPVRQGWKLAGDTKPFETTGQNYRFRMEAPSRETAKLKIVEEYEFSNSFALVNFTPDLLAQYVRNKALSDAAQKQLQHVLDLKEQMVAAQADVSGRQEEINEMFRDQERLRQNINNLRNLPGQQDQVNAYAAKLNGQEKQLEAKNATLTAARAKVRGLQQQIDQLINSLTVD